MSFHDSAYDISLLALLTCTHSLLYSCKEAGCRCNMHVINHSKSVMHHHIIPCCTVIEYWTNASRIIVLQRIISQMRLIKYPIKLCSVLNICLRVAIFLLLPFILKNNGEDDDGDNDEEWEFVWFTSFRCLSHSYFRFPLEMRYPFHSFMSYNFFLLKPWQFLIWSLKLKKGNEFEEDTKFYLNFTMPKSCAQRINALTFL